MSAFGCKADIRLRSKPTRTANISAVGLSQCSDIVSALRIGCASRRPADGVMNGVAVPHDIIVSGYELLERCIDVVEIDVGDETIDAGIDAGGFLAMQITPRGDEPASAPRSASPRAIAASGS